MFKKDVDNKKKSNKPSPIGEADESTSKIRKGLLIFCIIIFLIIVGLSIGILIINLNSK